METGFFLSLSCGVGLLIEQAGFPAELRAVAKQLVKDIEEKRIDVEQLYEDKEHFRTYVWKWMHEGSPREALAGFFMMFCDSLSHLPESKALDTPTPRKRGSTALKARPR